MARALRAGGQAAAVLRAGAVGRVVSVSEHAVNLLFDDGLIGLLPEGAPIHPWAVTVRGRGRARPGDQMEVDVSGVAVLDLLIDHRPAQIEPRLPELLLARVEPLLEDDWYEVRLGAAVERFVAGEPEALADILGVGEGLTPSGDDIVVGVLAALDWSREIWPAGVEARTRIACTIQPGVTTELAYQLLGAAAQGAYAEVILEVLGALGGPGAQTTVDRLLAVGHRSGRDTLRGLAVGLRYRPAADGVPDGRGDTTR